MNMPMLASLVMAIVLSPTTAVHAVQATATRQVAVHNQGRKVMPFDLNKTQHIFQPTDWGGIEIVVVRNPKDTHQLALIRAHLKHETQRFKAGDFSDPAAIHGKDMPGLAQISAAAKHIVFDYAALPTGAALVYETKEPALISALHNWFMAQSRDHGHDAMPD